MRHRSFYPGNEVPPCVKPSWEYSKVLLTIPVNAFPCWNFWQAIRQILRKKQCKWFQQIAKSKMACMCFFFVGHTLFVQNYGSRMKQRRNRIDLRLGCAEPTVLRVPVEKESPSCPRWKSLTQNECHLRCERTQNDKLNSRSIKPQQGCFIPVSQRRQTKLKGNLTALEIKPIPFQCECTGFVILHKSTHSTHRNRVSNLATTQLINTDRLKLIAFPCSASKTRSSCDIRQLN